jgi:chromosome partitioning protein
VLERELIYKLTKEKFDLNSIVERLFEMMKNELKKTKKAYDYILIDCAPGISALTEVSIRLADLVIVPTIPDQLCTYGLQAFCNSMWTGSSVKCAAHRNPKHPHVLITRRRFIKEHNRTAEKIRNESSKAKPSFTVFKTEIPERAAISEALGLTKKFPAFSSKWGEEVVTVLNKLAEETRGLLNGH